MVQRVAKVCANAGSDNGTGRGVRKFSSLLREGEKGIDKVDLLGENGYIHGAERCKGRRGRKTGRMAKLTHKTPCGRLATNNAIILKNDGRRKIKHHRCIYGL
mmetsp:Transcript_30843/g.47691  ORF Transcript_30843/g.47691 Transcript_30843/m.47691 type:complete len:103 (-) Transcript_30843:143-451(-)